MIIFGYQNKFAGPVKAVLAIIFGILLICMRVDIMTLLVKLIALSVLVFGIVSLVLGLRDKKTGPISPLLLPNAILNIIIAVLFFIFASEISAFIRYLLGALLVLLSINQMAVLISTRKQLGGGIWPFAIPLLVLLAGILFFWPTLIVGSLVGIIAGSAFILYGISELIASFRVRPIINMYLEENTPPVQDVDEQNESQKTDSNDDIKDVVAEKVEE